MARGRCGSSRGCHGRHALPLLLPLAMQAPGRPAAAPLTALPPATPRHTTPRRHPKVLALPHLGSITEEVYAGFAGILAENIRRAGEGRELLHRLC
jgi:hypothetical protein